LDIHLERGCRLNKKVGLPENWEDAMADLKIREMNKEAPLIFGDTSRCPSTRVELGIAILVSSPSSHLKYVLRNFNSRG
jgi:hypothetical protein